MSIENGDEIAYPVNEYSYALTKRELFSAMAMQGILANPDEQFVGISSQSTADFSVKMADYLLVALESKNEN